ncbi:hypothetical protein USDA257_p00420 (plasmid) [Sinorhizobium fredii USDA 257]|uniref:Uncharacterized protein n=1 Tax=Sinorhizobium fredii (strain USDA 257) TaxID=1185652 RepID=I3XFV4_SINF2|nr:hypothetical protein USDA257_p00420 [Sinorhizobium fredii USDA 257]
MSQAACVPFRANFASVIRLSPADTPRRLSRGALESGN